MKFDSIVQSCLQLGLNLLGLKENSFLATPLKLQVVRRSRYLYMHLKSRVLFGVYKPIRKKDVSLCYVVIIDQGSNCVSRAFEEKTMKGIITAARAASQPIKPSTKYNSCPLTV